MKVIVESGATKSDWRVFDSDGNQTQRVILPGMNVSSMKIEEIEDILSQGIAATECVGADAIYLYVAGVLTDGIREKLSRILSVTFKKVDVQNDLIGAARSLFGSGCGIVAIMGTGSNTCFYDGKNVSQKVFSGGYVIGDYGSASALGKDFLSDFIKNRIPGTVARDFAKEFDASYDGIVTGVYKSPSPAKYLGSLAPFIIRHYNDPHIKALVDDNFNRFIEKSLLAYDTSSYPVGVVGSFAYACRDIFLPLCKAVGIDVQAFCPEPIEDLIKYHFKKG